MKYKFFLYLAVQKFIKGPALPNKRSSSLWVLSLRIKTLTSALKFILTSAFKLHFLLYYNQAGRQNLSIKASNMMFFTAFFPVKAHRGYFFFTVSPILYKICQLSLPSVTRVRCLLTSLAVVSFPISRSSQLIQDHTEGATGAGTQECHVLMLSLFCFLAAVSEPATLVISVFSYMSSINSTAGMFSYS